MLFRSEDVTLSGDGVVNEGVNATIAGLRGIPKSAEEVMIARNVMLAESQNAKIHIAHISTANSVEIIRNAKMRGVKVTCETCPHYFSASDEEILTYNTSAKINPPLREQEDIDAIIEGIKDGTIDAIATDHAPHSYDEKNREFDVAPFGTVGFETALSVTYTYLVGTGEIDMVSLVRIMSKTPSRLLGLPETGIKVGLSADICLFDPATRWTVDSAKLASKGKNSLYDGWTLIGKVMMTIVNGKIKHEQEI